ncbi:MAG TPA: DUF983 domain-containing protein [Geminicoccaceae bacterium]|nr:DUF983 domain-containing protein [Geminicoccus sp.]HMU51924.1 DUF983 domain-containing protein [Geminicoccaceae bacterium]
MPIITDTAGRPAWPAALRGLCGKCPRCGRARLFAGYLRQVDACSHCGEPWSAIRADDAPPWLTILIVGHIMAPFMIAVIRDELMPVWMATVSCVLAALLLCLLILPRAKGLFIALIWAWRAGAAR